MRLDQQNFRQVRDDFFLAELAAEAGFLGLDVFGRKFKVVGTAAFRLLDLLLGGGQHLAVGVEQFDLERSAELFVVGILDGDGNRDLVNGLHCRRRFGRRPSRVRLRRMIEDQRGDRQCDDDGPNHAEAEQAGPG